MKKQELDYNLPQKLISQSPASPRDHSRLMIIKNKENKILHKHFYNLPDFLDSNSVLVFNKTKVFPARITGIKETGGKIGVLLLKNLNEYEWEALVKGNIKPGQTIFFENEKAEIIKQKGKIIIIRFESPYSKLLNKLEKIGKTPLPPYIKPSQNSKIDRKRYQTVFAKILGSAAAPTAGLHFTKSLIKKLKKKNIQIEFITLHVGLGTFEPIKEEKIENHQIHEEYFEIGKATYTRILKAKKEGKKIIAVGTTSVRALESLPKLKGETKIFIYPPYKFKYVDAIITNFHMPGSTLLALIFAFLGKNKTKKIYELAIKKNYRFLSFGDAMLLI